MKNFKVIYEDKDLLVVDKPAGVLVHPTEAHEPDTLADWLIEKYPEIKNLSWPDSTRAGIVHRLDKDTSGLIILAKNPGVLTKLQEMFKGRQVKKTYQALVYGRVPQDEGRIEAAIVRHPAKDMMSVQDMTYSFTKGTARPALTEYKVLDRYKYKKDDLTLVEVYPQTGRMHQIRVHFKHIGHPIIGDQLYFIKPSKRISKELGLNRQFLHAVKLSFTHPETGENLHFESPLAEDLQTILNKLK